MKTAASSSNLQDPDTETNDERDYYYDTDDDTDDTDDKSNASKSVDGDPHRKCYTYISRMTDEMRSRYSRWPTRPEPIRLSINLLYTCRQISHEAHSILYSTNTFSFQHPALLTKFTSHISALPSGSQTLSLRHLHLHMDISTKPEESAWNRALRTVARRFTNLKSVDISIDQATWDHLDLGVGKNKNASMSKKTIFLSGLAEFRNLTLLKHMTLMVSEYRGREWVGPKEGKLLWLEVQGKDWARDVVADILDKKKKLMQDWRG